MELTEDADSVGLIGLGVVSTLAAGGAGAFASAIGEVSSIIGGRRGGGGGGGSVESSVCECDCGIGVVGSVVVSAAKDASEAAASAIAEESVANFPITTDFCVLFPPIRFILSIKTVCCCR